MSIGPSGGYFQWLRDIAPSWLQRPLGGALLSTIGLSLDQVQEGAVRAMRARFPTGAAPDAQDATGADRQLPRIEVLGHEDDVSYGARLKRAWEDLAFARTKTGLQIICAYIGFPVVQVFDQQELNAPTDPWGLVWILVSKPNPWGPPRGYDDGSRFDAGITYDLTANAAAIANLRAVLRPWIGGHNELNVEVDLGGSKFDDGTTYDSGHNYDEGVVVIPVRRNA